MNYVLDPDAEIFEAWQILSPTEAIYTFEPVSFYMKMRRKKDGITGRAK